MILTQRLAAILMVTGLVVVPTEPLAAQDGVEWTFESHAGADLWFHALAVIGFEASGPLSTISESYAAEVRRAKEAAGVYPTRLDEAASRLLEDLEKEPGFQVFHSIPLYFAAVERDRMFSALGAVAKGRLGDTELVDREARPGVGSVARALNEGGHRRLLGRFLDLLEDEWDVFYEDYWQEQVEQGLAGRREEIQQAWWDSVEPAMEEFLRARRLDRGTVLISPALGPEGRLHGGIPASRSDNVIAAPLPLTGTADETIFGTVYQACYSIVSEAMQAPGVIASQLGSVSLAVRCGERLMGKSDPELADRYVRAFTALASAGENGEVTFEEAYALDPALERALNVLTETTAGPRARAGRPAANFGWVFQPQPHVDLWFHTLAVISADTEGPLGLYSADYARRIRDAKREAGVYPTALDSMVGDLRERLADDRVLQTVHFVPLYLARVTPDRFLDVVDDVVERRLERLGGFPPDVNAGLEQLVFAFEDRTNRRLMRELIDVMRLEWDVFFKDYWERAYEEDLERFEAMQRLWDDEIEPQLGAYLETRRLTSGLVLPSAPLGPEGRIIEFDPFDPADQVVAVQVPAGADPSAPVYAFIKELCFLLVDAGELDRFAGSADEAEDLQRRAAVRCGAMLLEFYAPVLAMRYRRSFLDAVGAEEGSSITAFERVYYLDAEVLNVVRQQVRRDR